MKTRAINDAIAAVGLVLAGSISTGSTAAQTRVIDQDFDPPDPSYAFAPVTTGGATVELVIGDVFGSDGLIYAGSVDLDPGASAFAIADWGPTIATFDDFQFDPMVVGGIAYVSASADAALNGFPSDTDNLNELRLSLELLQADDMGIINSWIAELSVTDEALTTVQWVQLRAADFINSSGSSPDFSADANPIAFGLRLGAGFQETTNQFPISISGHLRVDNWRVDVFGDALFSDGYE